MAGYAYSFWIVGLTIYLKVWKASIDLQIIQ